MAPSALALTLLATAEENEHHRENHSGVPLGVVSGTENSRPLPALLLPCPCHQALKSAHVVGMDGLEMGVEIID